MAAFLSIFYVFSICFFPLVAEIKTFYGSSMDSLKQIIDLTQFSGYLTSETVGVSLESLMLNGEKSDLWNQSAKTVGEFLAKFNQKTSLLSLNDADRERLLDLFKTSKNHLQTWLNETAMDEESILAILPEKQRPSADAIGLRKKSEAARQILSTKESINLQNLTSNRILIDSNNQSKIPSENDFIIGPSSLDVAIFLADMIINYYQMQTRHVDHSVQYKVVDVSNEFGKSYELTSQELNPKFKNETFWKDVALLTGWEIVRRCHSLDRVKILSEENQFGGTADCLQAGLRLVGNNRITSVNFLMVVALMLAF